MKKFVITLIVFFLFITLAETIMAIPAFGRKYKLSCQTCHSPIPRLKAYGDDFAGNGFQLSDREAPRYYMETGDQELSLIRDFPLAVRLDAHATYQTNKPEQGDLKTPYLLKLMSGGALTKDIAYYFYFYLSERGEVAGVEDAYIMFNNLFGEDLDIYLGQFQVSDPLFKRELRLTLEDYGVYKTKPGLSSSNLAYDRGMMITYGSDIGTDIIFEWINGNGLREADGNKLYDKDNFKNFMLRISQEAADFLRVGFFAYYGKEKQLNSVSPLAQYIDNDFLMVGPDITLSYKDMFELNMQYVKRTDNSIYRNEMSTFADNDIETKGAMAELLYTPDGDQSKWYAAGLFNWIESDYTELKYRSATAHAGYLLRRNMRLVGEYTYNLEENFGLMSIGIVTAF